ncbi:MAG: hypothetical protein HY914_11425 [Desulfomonile tiedjei]|nr:hypothetical protein [Desulfomonile tiedjei]
MTTIFINGNRITAAPADTKFFDFEGDRMYSRRESELIQQHLQQYGEMPGGGDEDDLF